MKAKKHLGQHFLHDRNTINRIIEALEAEPGDPILEIGPGPATLTAPLNKLGFPLTVVETDADMAQFLAEQDFDPPVHIIHADFLTVDLNTVVPPGTKVISNLPYNVSVPITARLLERARHIPTMVMMYQKEVAERVRARPNTKDYGPISVLAQCFYQFDLHFNVGPGAFKPPPKVMSQVIRFRRLAEPLAREEDLERFTELVRFLFAQRRKMIGGRLKKWDLHWSAPHTLLESLEACGLDPKDRPENLSPGDYAAWFYRMKNDGHTN